MDVDGKVSQTDYGRCGGMLSGRLGPNKFIVDYAKGLRSKCKRHRCKHAFRDGELRVGKIPPRARKDVPARRVHWYHPACIFKSFERASKKTKTIDTVEDMEGFSELKEADKADLTSRVAAWVARKAAMNANYKPKKRKRRGGDWLPSPTQSFDNTASFDDGEEDDGEEEADEEVASGEFVWRVEAEAILGGSAPGAFVESAPFALCGHDWTLRVYPEGLSPRRRGLPASCGLPACAPRPL